MRILERFITDNRHFGPGDEVELAKSDAYVGIGVATKAVDPDGKPWTASELATARAADVKARDLALQAEKAAEVADFQKRHVAKTAEAAALTSQPARKVEVADAG